MRIPRYIKIAGHKYKILFPFKFKKNKQLLGSANYTTLTIKVADTYYGEKLKPSRIWEILIHEIFHCINTHYNDNKIKEAEIARLSEGIYQVLSDNKLLKEK